MKNHREGPPLPQQLRALFPPPLKQKLIEFSLSQTKKNLRKLPATLSRNSQLTALNRSQDGHATMEAPQ
jgi:hypothetical protein